MKSLSWLDNEMEKEPFYFYMRDLDEHIRITDEAWILNYTSIFFRNLITEIITGVKEYFQNNNIKPYESIKSNNYWLNLSNRK